MSRATGQAKKMGKVMPNYWLARETAVKYLKGVEIISKTTS